MPSSTLAPLSPTQEAPWPTASWPEARLGDVSGLDVPAVESALEALFDPSDDAPCGETHAVLAVHRGRLVVERYGREQDVDTTLISWSMAKSITHALVGVLVGEGRLDPASPAPVPAWQGADDPRSAIRLEDLLRMVDGLDFVEDYVDEQVSNVIDMLFGRGKADVAGYAESIPSAHPPGRVWSYSSGTSNIVSAIVGRTVGGGRAGMEAFMRAALFDRLGMKSAKPRFDEAGTFIGSSYVFATARDFARFGLLYLRDGVWDGERILPDGWADHARTPTRASEGQYGAHFWLATDGSGIFHCSGYRGQYIAIDPVRDLVLVRLGASQDDRREPLLRALARIDRAFPAT